MFIGASFAFGVCLDLMVYIFVAVVIYVFLVVNEGWCDVMCSEMVFKIVNLFGVRSNWRSSRSGFNTNTWSAGFSAIWHQTKKVFFLHRKPHRE